MASFAVPILISQPQDIEGSTNVSAVPTVHQESTHMFHGWEGDKWIVNLDYLAIFLRELGCLDQGCMFVFAIWFHDSTMP